MASFEPTDTRKIAAVSTSVQEDFEKLCTGLIVSVTADTYIDFDRPATTGSLLVKANLAPVYLPVKFTKLSVITASTANVHVCALRTLAG